MPPRCQACTEEPFSQYGHFCIEPFVTSGPVVPITMNARECCKFCSLEGKINLNNRKNIGKHDEDQMSPHRSGTKLYTKIRRAFQRALLNSSCDDSKKSHCQVGASSVRETAPIYCLYLPVHTKL